MRGALAYDESIRAPSTHPDALRNDVKGRCLDSIRPSGDGPVARGLARLRALEATVAYPYLLNLLEYHRLENEDSEERVDVIGGLESGNFSVEHVMPQTLSDAWRRELGEDCEQIHEQWLHSIANLTLTAYNSDYSNRPFAQKRDMAKGFRASGFRTNQWIAAQERWGADELEERCEQPVDKFFGGIGSFKKSWLKQARRKSI